MSDTRKMVPRATGDIVVSGAGSLPTRYVLHAITIGPWGQAKQLPLGAMVRQITHRLMPATPPRAWLHHGGFYGNWCRARRHLLATFRTDLNLNNSFDLDDRCAGPHLFAGLGFILSRESLAGRCVHTIIFFDLSGI